MFLSFIQEFLRLKDQSIPLLTEREIRKINTLILSKSSPPLAILPEERELIQEIKAETKQKNQNNITRTMAYLDYYQENQEIEWSFLAHMVSRNAGYHMTDLKAHFLPSFLKETEARHFFLFLEKANAFIFHDAYPQLLLYKKSVEKQKSLFHLLPAFGVSRTMSVFWERFWKQGDTLEMTLALIINEQSMIQKRLVSKIKENKYQYEKVLFLLQDRLELTTVFFPYKKRETSAGAFSLAGSSVSHFESTKKRVDIGKKLYAILFKNKKVLRSSFNFAKNTPHTGSRSDYWPDSYSPLNSDGRKVFSPFLSSAWQNHEHTFIHEEWAGRHTLKNIDALKTLSIPAHFDVTTHAKIMVKLSS
ncbi:DUF2515 domain-containing protein [Bacillus salacetis]|uniref:DUF2515 domain-containing protein n=1 Tax=Bacillus salacetis TaxID=2315464 RepID=A0A3A1QN51_9BACI|nr:DUF2515 family protein [Bacillus salacetis]RIW28515.1 DUF2515 domain-containing protein [Bacillus salacetis]